MRVIDTKPTTVMTTTVTRGVMSRLTRPARRTGTWRITGPRGAGVPPPAKIVSHKIVSHKIATNKIVVYKIAARLRAKATRSVLRAGRSVSDRSHSGPASARS
jgi:CRP-like cAMP-binding protein